MNIGLIKTAEPFDHKGYKAREYHPGVAIILDHTRIQETADFIEQEGITCLEINPNYYHLENLNCLVKFRQIEHIRLINHTMDIEGIHYLTSLKTMELGVENGQPVDFKNFPHLSSCHFQWSNKRSSILDCNQIELLGIANYHKDDLTELATMINLKYLGLGNSKVKSLNGIEEFNRLENLGLEFMTKLESLAGIESLTKLKEIELYSLRTLASIDAVAQIKSLQRINIEKCKRVERIDGISSCNSLCQLYLNNMGDIQSLLPIKDLSNLKKLLFWEETNIVDGDLDFLLNMNLEVLSFQNRKHYSIKRDLESDELSIK